MLYWVKEQINPERDEYSNTKNKMDPMHYTNTFFVQPGTTTKGIWHNENYQDCSQLNKIQKQWVNRETQITLYLYNEKDDD